jgi:hypothetical protein
MKKALAETQQKMENRINLFKKASDKMRRQQEINYKVFSKIEAVRAQSPLLRRFHSRKQTRTEPVSRHINTKEHHS